MPRMTTMFAALLLSVVALPAFAQEETDDAGQRIKYKERTEIDFEGVDVQGELVKPQGSLLIEAKRIQFNPLIRLRENFDVEMKQSVDEVK
ncbi:MAG TPA: hypothetical protein PKA64_00625 [Myxococcota bacterium]|nr:hypothetical protein [Myxococcota bacterium]